MSKPMSKKMENKKVAVLLSTYNGEKYLEQQLQSIFYQTYKNIELYVRDDGSTDGTLDILKKYENQGMLKLTVGENLGYCESFYSLLRNTNEADYYSFADQDDIWLENKIKTAVTALNGVEKEMPALYFCEFDYYDTDMNFVSHKKKLRQAITFPYALASFSVYAFTCVFNSEMRELFLKMPSGNSFPPDYLLLQLAASMGKVLYDTDVYAKYRRHEKNASMSNQNFIKLLFWRIKNFLINDNFDYKAKWSALYDVYCEELSVDDKAILSWFAEEKYRLAYALRKSFYSKRYRETLFDEIAVRFMFAVGRL